MLKKIINKLKKVVTPVAPGFLWSLFSMKRMFGKKTFGFLSEELFSKEFISKKFTDIGGFGMTASIITEFYHPQKKKDFDAAIVFSKILPDDMPWRFHVNGSDVISVPNVRTPDPGNFLKYSFETNKKFNFLLSIDMYPWYEVPLKAMPRTPLIIWIRDPKSEVELTKIAAVGSELAANNMKSLDEFKGIARAEREFFLNLHEQSQKSKRPIMFVTNAQFMVPRAQRLYSLKTVQPVFLPNPIHIATEEKINTLRKTEKPTVCVLSRLDPVKRPWIIFELAKRFKDVDFMICGNSSYPKIINPLIEQYRSVTNLKFLGLVEGQQKEDILAKSWVLLNTSIHEGLPCSFLEAFSYRTPVISSVDPDGLVSKFGSFVDSVGYGMDEATYKMFQNALENLLSNKKALEEKGIEARKHIEKLYCFPTFEEKLKDILAHGIKNNYTV